MKAKAFIVLMVIVFPVILFSQNCDIKFTHFTINEGLSHNSVRCIFQDDIGYLYVGTNNGLNRFDGDAFTVFLHKETDSLSISHNYVSCITQDSIKQIWIGTDDGLNLFNRATESFSVFRPQSNKANSLPNQYIKSLCFVPKSGLWVGTFRGLSCYNFENKIFENYYSDSLLINTLSNNCIYSLVNDSSKRIWIGTAFGLNVIDCVSKKVIRIINGSNGSVLKTSNDIRALRFDNNGTLWIGTSGGGLFYLTQENQRVVLLKKTLTYKFNPYINSSSKTAISNSIYSLMLNKSGDILVGNENEGITIVNTKNGKNINYSNNINQPYSLLGNTVYSILEDRQNNLWVGTFTGGLNLYSPYSNKFQSFNTIKDEPSRMAGNIVQGMVETHAGDIWIGTDGGGLEYFNREQKTFKHFQHAANNGTICSNNISAAIVADKIGNLWIGTWNGLSRFNLITKQCTNFKNNPREIGTLADNTINSLMVDRDGVVWVATHKIPMLHRFNSSQNNFERISIGSEIVNLIFQDRNKQIWIGTYTNFYKLIKTKTGFQLQVGLNTDVWVHCVHEDGFGTLWLGTNMGIYSCAEKSNKFFPCPVNPLLPSTRIMKILQDKTGNLWISTDKGLVKWNPYKEKLNKKESVKIYDSSDGLPTNEFLFNAGMISLKGDMYFGTTNGLVLFNPDSLYDNPFKPTVVLTTLHVFDQLILPQSKLLQLSINETHELILSHKELVFSIGYAALNFSSSKMNQYAVKMEGFDANYRNMGNDTKVTYTNLTAGTYIFKVKAANNDGLWNEIPKILIIRILPAPWKTWWAYTLYATALLLLFYWLRFNMLQKQMLKNKAKIESLEFEKKLELDEIKLRFFANISHEFRTPLTLIAAPINNILQSALLIDSPLLLEQARLIQRNTGRLIELTNQLLDMQKLQAGSLKPEISFGDVLQFLIDVCNKFNLLAQSKQIDFRVTCAVNQVDGWFDADKTEKIVANLLSNAFKFTSTKVEVRIKCENDFLFFEVEDNGLGISHEQQTKIFDRFYQVDSSATRVKEGTGIGLALAKELVVLLGGKLFVKSDPGTFTSFTVTFPLKKENFIEHKETKLFADNSNAIQDVSLSKDLNLIENITNTSPDDAPIILVVENNADMRLYLKMILASYYKVIDACNGMQGYDLAIEQIPDLILSDVMMPEMDGIEMTGKLKNDQRTSHIPVILLTAVAAAERKLTGFKNGADDYITKPFNDELLLIRVKNLIYLCTLVRQQSLLKYGIRQGAQEVYPQEIVVSSSEDHFIVKVKEIAEKYIPDSEFSNDIFASELSMSAPVLVRKMKAIFNQTPADFMRDMRMKRAAQLLKQNKFSVAEITLLVGFSDPKYFGKTFKKYFGSAPTDYVNKSGA